MKRGNRATNTAMPNTACRRLMALMALSLLVSASQHFLLKQQPEVLRQPEYAVTADHKDPVRIIADICTDTYHSCHVFPNASFAFAMFLSAPNVNPVPSIEGQELVVPASYFDYLHASLKRLVELSRMHVVVFVTKEVPETMTRELAALAGEGQVIIQQIGEMTMPYASDRAQHSQTFSKLLMYQPGRFKKLVFLDADVFPLQNVDELFCMPGFAASKRKAVDKEVFNSAVVVIEPNADDWHALQVAFQRAQQPEHHVNGEQDLLRQHFGGKIQHCFSPVYNCAGFGPGGRSDKCSVTTETEALESHKLFHGKFSTKASQHNLPTVQRIWTEYLPPGLMVCDRAPIPRRLALERCATIDEQLSARVCGKRGHEVFVDLGGNYGSSIERALEWMPRETEFHIFEPNPQFDQRLLDLAAPMFAGYVYPVAVSTRNEVRTFFMDNQTIVKSASTNIVYEASGSSLIDRSHLAIKSLLGDPTPVCVMDFVGWLTRNFSPEQKVTVKVDVKGAEFELIEELLKSDALHLIDTMMIEWHGLKIRPELLREHPNLEKDLEAQLVQKGVRVVDWGE